jgi:sugar phosphate permease
MLPTFLLAGLGFALAFGPLNIAGTTGVAAHEQGLAGGLLNTSFQFGGALVLAIVTAVINANTGHGAQGVLDAYHAAIYVSVGAALLGILAMVSRRRTTAVDEVPVLEPAVELIEEAA